jgi:hypothetical protein
MFLLSPRMCSALLVFSNAGVAEASAPAPAEADAGRRLFHRAMSSRSASLPACLPADGFAYGGAARHGGTGGTSGDKTRAVLLAHGARGACPLFLVAARAAYSQGTGASAQQRVIRLVSSPAGQGLARDPRPGLRSLDLSRWLLSSHVTRGEA